MKMQKKSLGVSGWEGGRVGGGGGRWISDVFVKLKKK